MFQPHRNGVFDAQWSPSDDLLATAAADQTVGISKLTPRDATCTHSLVHHQSTVKCVAWDPTRDGDVLCSGSRDGMICVWDLRKSGKGGETKPVLVVAKAHDTSKSPVRKGKLHSPPARGVTSLVFSGAHEYGLISGGSFDGCAFQYLTNAYSCLLLLSAFCASGTSGISTINVNRDERTKVAFKPFSNRLTCPLSIQRHTTTRAAQGVSRVSRRASDLHEDYCSPSQTIRRYTHTISLLLSHYLDILVTQTWTPGPMPTKTCEQIHSTCVSHSRRVVNGSPAVGPQTGAYFCMMLLAAGGRDWRCQNARMSLQRGGSRVSSCMDREEKSARWTGRRVCWRRVRTMALFVYGDRI